ncbi:MAG: TIGR02302 family protein [Rhodospirillales bacterium]
MAGVAARQPMRCAQPPERDSGLTHQPLQALEDELAAGRDDMLAEALWHRHRERMAALVKRLRICWPDAGMARHEPWGIRVGVLLLLVIAATAGSGDPAARLTRALDWQARSSSQTAGVELWITPPAYTRAAPMFVSTTAPPAEGAPAVLSVPAGSALLARATGVRRTPELRIAGASVPFAPLGQSDGKDAWRAEAVVTGGDRITVRTAWRELASWPIAVVADAPPQPAFARPPAKEGNGLLALAYRATDDYGVAEMAAVLEPAPDAAPAEVPALRVALPLDSPGAAQSAGTSLQDFSAHPLAGLPVRLRLEARDAAGQVSVSETVETVLPEREFAHPVARLLVALRKRLSGPEPSLRERAGVMAELAGQASRPGEFGSDVVVSLALAVAQARLRLDATPQGLASVRDLLWDTALRIEQGDVPLAERQLEQARQDLTDALQRNAPAAEIDRLMDALQQALDRYLAAAAAELARRGQQTGPLDADAQMLRSDELRDLIEAARELARSGGRDGAMQMLSALQQMLDGLRAGLRTGANPALAEAQALMQALRDLGSRQQRLLDDSFQRLREQQARQERGPRSSGREGPRDRARAPSEAPLSGQSQESMPSPSGSRPGGAGRGGGTAEQQALRGELGELMLRLDQFLGSIPQPLGDADQAMKGAAEALGQGRLGEAVPRQTGAVDALQRAIEDARQAMAQRLGQGMALGQNDGSGDVFGRRPDGRRGFASGTLKIPDRGSLQRAQEIVDELRRRAAERSRSADELDYIERLLRRF